uniref:Uncharacterized protein n=1 Tax=Annulohypoxylon stygium TaxID=326628 RepID=V5RG64_9PEZI|nr:hypothetical protein [Annulohypoxylon stygium]AHB33550.1 hypothetical protein [Annulohypoxylon stygium]AYE67587.1 hypothetical protein [Annulohypoxylon stygium]
MSLFSLIFKFVHKYLNPKKFFLNLGKNFLKYIIFILPFILVFKTLYSCILNGVWDYQFFSQQFISNFPFVGKILYGIFWKESSLLSIDTIYYNQWIMETTFVGSLGGILGRTIFETYFSDFIKVPLGGETLMSEGNVNTMNQDSGSKSSDSAGSKSGSSTVPKSGSSAEPKWISEGGSKSSSSKIVYTIPPEYSDIVHQDIKNATEDFRVSNLKSVNMMTKINESSSKINLKLPGEFWVLISNHSNMLNIYFEQRITWSIEISKHLYIKDRLVVNSLIEKKRTLHEEYLTNIEKLSDGGDLVIGLKQFFNLTNAYRNAANKEINTIEWTIHESIRRTHPLYKNSELKQTVNIDYPKFKKNFSDEDQKLRKRFSEILNAPKK